MRLLRLDRSSISDVLRGLLLLHKEEEEEEEEARLGDTDADGKGDTDGGREIGRNGNRYEVRVPGVRREGERAIIGVLDLPDLSAQKCLSFDCLFFALLSLPLRPYCPISNCRLRLALML